MKGLSLWQPWASLIGWYEKSIETRSWWTDYRGLVAIHATKTSPPDGDVLMLEMPFAVVMAEHRLTALADLPHGAIVAVAALTNVVRVMSHAHAYAIIAAHGSRYELELGDYAVGRYAWVLKDVVGLEEPIPWRGGRMLWALPTVLESKLKQEHERLIREERPKNRRQAWL